MGFDRILTSGERSTAMEGSRRIAELVKRAGGRITIMPGSGINENNVTDLVRFTGVTEVHSSAKLQVQSLMGYKNDHIVRGNSYNDEYSVDVTDVGRVREILKNANG